MLHSLLRHTINTPQITSVSYGNPEIINISSAPVYHYFSSKRKSPLLPPVFFQMDIRHDHVLVNCLAHVINGKKRHLNTCQRLHLHACFSSVFTVQNTRITPASSSVSKSTEHFWMGRGWHMGISSEVRLTPMIPATRATPSTSPFSHFRFLPRP